MPVTQDFEVGAYHALAAANKISLLGGTDSTVSGNATVALLAAAIRNLAPVAGASPDLNEKVARGIENGLKAGVLSSTHGYSTIATLKAGIDAFLPGVDVSFGGFLPQ